MPIVPSVVRIMSDQLLFAVQHASSSCQDTCVRNWKIIFSIILFIEGLVFGHVVLLLRRLTEKRQNAFRKITRIGQSFSAGVFFTTGALHVLPGSIALLSGQSDAGDQPSGNVDEEDGDNVKRNSGNGENDAHAQSASFPWAFFVLVVGFYSIFFIEKILFPKLFPKSLGDTHPPNVHDKVSDSSQSGEEHRINAQNDEHESDESTEQDSSQLETRLTSPTFLLAILQIVGISTHSLFESIALGLSSNIDTLLNVFIASAAHRWATAVAIAFTAAQTFTYLPFISLFLLFTAMVPLGVGMGAILSKLSPEFQGVLFTISAATFFYIGISDTMGEGVVLSQSMIRRKFLATIAGSAIISVITAVLVVLDIY